MFETISTQIGAAVMVAVAGFAFLKGERPERIGIGAYLLAWLATILVQSQLGFDSAPWLVFAVDVAVLVVFIALTWKSHRSWPIWASGLQLLIVMSHIARITNLNPPTLVVITVFNLASYGILVSIAIGTFWAWQERRAAGLE